MTTKPKSTKAKTTVIHKDHVPEPVAPIINSNIDVSVFVDAVRADLDAVLDAETGIGNRTQHMAWEIHRYRDALGSDIAWERLATSSEARSTWMTNMRRVFLGQAPSLSTAGGVKVTQSMRDARTAYGDRLRLFDQALWLSIALGNAHVSADNFSETLNCFSVPPSVIIPKGDAPAYNLLDFMTANPTGLIPLLNQSWTTSGPGPDGKTGFADVRSSVKQVLSVFRAKPPAAKPPSPTIVPNTTNGPSSVQATAGAQSNPQTSVASTVITSVLRNAGVEKLAPALLAAFNADPDVKITRDMFDTKVWETLMSIGQIINRLAADADAASKAKPNDKSSKAA